MLYFFHLLEIRDFKITLSLNWQVEKDSKAAWLFCSQTKPLGSVSFQILDEAGARVGLGLQEMDEERACEGKRPGNCEGLSLLKESAREEGGAEAPRPQRHFQNAALRRAWHLLDMGTLCIPAVCSHWSGQPAEDGLGMGALEHRTGAISSPSKSKHYIFMAVTMLCKLPVIFGWPWLPLFLAKWHIKKNIHLDNIIWKSMPLSLLMSHY